ncbi:MAG TPA: DUF5723 family protein [Puia sp.]|nr:DUF5723 family protein [Puia sp.]
MKKMIAFLICLGNCFYLLAQQNLGIRNSNYAGIQGSLLNPSSIADSKLKWDINIISVDEVFDNTFLYAPKNSLSFFGVNKIIKGSIHEDLFLTHFNSQDPGKLYNLTFSAEVLGPSFFIKVAKKHTIGFTIAERSYSNIKDISGNLAQNSFAYLLQPDLWHTDFHDSTSRVNAMNWISYGFHYATVLYNKGRDELKGGISLNYLQGIAAAYTKNTNITYRINDTANIVFTNTSVDYGRTDIDTYRKINNYGDLNHGHGFGMDIGFTYLHLKDPAVYNAEQDEDKQKGSNYVYRIGVSLIDVGYINFNRNSASYHLQTDSANFSNWHQSKFSSNVQFDQTLSAVFYKGDSLKSLTANHFNMALPAAISIQADWNIYKNFFANLTIIKGLGHGNNPGVTRPDVYSLTPRYETLWGEVSIPMSLLYYNQWRPRIGMAVRVYYFFIGGDAPGSLLKLNDLQGVDFYAGIHVFLAEKTKNNGFALHNQ